MYLIMWESYVARVYLIMQENYLPIMYLIICDNQQKLVNKRDVSHIYDVKYGVRRQLWCAFGKFEHTSFSAGASQLCNSILAVV